MNFERFERELQDLWAEIGILRAAINFPEGNLLSLNEDLKLLKSEVVDYFGLSDKVDQRIQGIEENFRKLKQEFEQFRQIMVLRLNTMAVDVINNEDLLNFYINSFNQSVANAFQWIYWLDDDAANLRRRVENLAVIEADQLLNAAAEQTVIIEEA